MKIKLTIPKDADVMNDLRIIKVEKGIAKIPEKRTKGNDGNKRHSDAATAIAFGVYASLKDPEIYEYTKNEDEIREMKFNEGDF